MKIEIEIRRNHAYLFSSLFVILISIGLVNAFGGSNPSVLGHSAQELIVNGSSVVDNSLTGDDILESSLGTVPSATSASSASSASNSNACSNDGNCEIANVNIQSGSGESIRWPGDAVVLRRNTNTMVIDGGLSAGQDTNVGSGVINGFNGVMAGSTLRIDGSGNLVNINSISASGSISTSAGSISATSGTISTGSVTVVRCTGCPSFDYLGPLGTSCGGCGGSVDTGLRVD